VPVPDTVYSEAGGERGREGNGRFWKSFWDMRTKGELKNGIWGKAEQAAFRQPDSQPPVDQGQKFAKKVETKKGGTESEETMPPAGKPFGKVKKRQKAEFTSCWAADPWGTR